MRALGGRSTDSNGAPSIELKTWNGKKEMMDVQVE